MSVESYRESPGKFDSRTLNRKTLNRWTGRTSVHALRQRPRMYASAHARAHFEAGSSRAGLKAHVNVQANGSNLHISASRLDLALPRPSGVLPPLSEQMIKQKLAVLSCFFVYNKLLCVDVLVTPSFVFVVFVCLAGCAVMLAQRPTASSHLMLYFIRRWLQMNAVATCGAAPPQLVVVSLCIVCIFVFMFLCSGFISCLSVLGRRRRNRTPAPNHAAPARLGGQNTM